MSQQVRDEMLLLLVLKTQHNAKEIRAEKISLHEEMGGWMEGCLGIKLQCNHFFLRSLGTKKRGMLYVHKKSTLFKTAQCLEIMTQHL